jgi:hypothetical protein
MGENEVMLVINHFPFERSGSFHFHPRLFKAGGATPEAIRMLTPQLEELLDRAIRSRGEVSVRARIVCVESVEDELLGSMYVNLDIWLTRKVRSVEELRRLYGQLTEHAERKYGCRQADVTLVFPLRPVEISLTSRMMREFFELLMTTDALLNVRTAKALFGREFAERVRQHNQEVRTSRP